MIRGGFKAFSRAKIVVRQPYVSSGLLRPVSLRRYASSLNNGDDFDGGQADRIEKIASTLRGNPEIRTLLEDFQTLLHDKGFRTDKAPSMVEMFKLMTEKDVKDHLTKLKDALDRADVKFSTEDIKAFMGFLTSQK
ncbi:uncharacterized protein PRCAT00002714001 [Priceomyces carsonii]|uniref:uncharacterized protein n=1 Tax=Priceomyces carsonii TaxID=28549 RepID=UPI002EDB1870|nr:unnamed protein product [Priceomyces carsonii]